MLENTEGAMKKDNRETTLDAQEESNGKYFYYKIFTVT
jgi:hypothetical protein